MMMKWNALALGLAATVIFSAGEIQAQGLGPGFSVTPAGIHVTSGGDFFIFSSNSFQDPTNDCAFKFPIHILDNDRGYEFPSIGAFGVVESDGSLTVDRDELLAALGLREAHFAQFCTSCGSNTGDYGAQALRNRIQELAKGESVTLHTLYFSEEFFTHPERSCDYGS
jgi:hypothetical protein